MENFRNNGGGGYVVNLNGFGSTPISFVYTDSDTKCNYSDQKEVIEKFKYLRSLDKIYLPGADFMKTTVYYDGLKDYLLSRRTAPRSSSSSSTSLLASMGFSALSLTAMMLF